MSNSHENKHLTERPALPALLAISLCATMLAFGCTTDRNLGNGTPVVTPGLRTSPTSGPSTGSESAPVPPPMMSSSTYPDGRPITRLSAAEAAAIMADNQPRVRVLGPVAPGNGRGYLSDLAQVGTRVNVPQYGNSSINSGVNNNGQASVAITSGAGEPIGSADTLAAAFIDANDLGTIFGDTGGTSAVDGTQTGTTGTTITPTGTTLTPTGAAIGVPSGTFASVGTLSPTAAAVVNPPASISSSPRLAATSSTRTAGRTVVTPANRTAATTATNATNLNTTVSATTIAPTTGAAVNPVRIVNTNGRVTVTNTSGNQR